MDDNHQDKTESKLIATEDKLWLPPLSLKDQEKVKQLREKPFAERTGFKGKTLWDWLNLLAALAIPLVVVAATIAFGIIQADLAQKQHDSDQAIANQQHAASQQQALNQQQATILQTYIDNIQDLLLKSNLPKSKPTDDVAILARARTLTALQGLDPHRKGVLLNFLYEARLIGYYSDFSTHLNPIINLSGADLSGADLSSTNLSGADLSSTNLNHAHLSNAELTGADLSFADLTGADLHSDYLSLFACSFLGLFHSGTDLASAHLDNAHLNNANLSEACLGYAHLGNADLSGADLGNADLSGADLNSAQLSFADLSAADLSAADLSYATVTPKQLASTYTLYNATLPDRSTFPSRSYPIPNHKEP